MGKVILNDDYVFEMIRFLSKIAAGGDPPGSVINLEVLNLFFRSIGISDNTLVLWDEEFFISARSTRIDLLQYKMEEFFIRKYCDWMSFPNSFEVKIDIDLEGI